MWTTFGCSLLNLESEIGDLSSNNFPNEIRRIELGDEGRVSQSATTSLAYLLSSHDISHQDMFWPSDANIEV
jgi:hypothetical protein